MSTTLSDQMSAATKEVMDSMMKLQEINDRTVQSLAKQQLEVVESYMTTGVKQIKAISETKDAKDALSAQADMAAELGNMLLGKAKQTMEVLTESRKELTDLMENNMKKFMDMAKQDPM